MILQKYPVISWLYPVSPLIVIVVVVVMDGTCNGGWQRAPTTCIPASALSHLLLLL